MTDELGPRDKAMLVATLDGVTALAAMTVMLSNPKGVRRLLEANADAVFNVAAAATLSPWSYRLWRLRRRVRRVARRLRWWR